LPKPDAQTVQTFRYTPATIAARWQYEAIKLILLKCIYAESVPQLKFVLT
jgi:hypothetical protein